jgi:large subunit ribosomal protein L2
MGKRLIQQRRGRGTPRYRSPSHRFKGAVSHLSNSVKQGKGMVLDIVHCAGHSAPLMAVEYETGDMSLSFAPAGIRVGDPIQFGGSELKTGNILSLKDVPEGTFVHNIEGRPGDGGKFVRGSGSFARVVAHTPKGVKIKLPSKKEKLFLGECRAAIGVISGSGRVDKPMLKAGTNFHRMKARNKLYPKVCGISMNAVDHPFGSGCSHSKGRPTQSPRSAPPGRKVGKIAPRRVGRKR